MNVPLRGFSYRRREAAPPFLISHFSFYIFYVTIIAIDGI